MQDDGYITCMNLNTKKRERFGKGQKRKARSEDEELQEYREILPSYIFGLRYALTKKGREYLGAYNPKRYREITDLILTPNEYDERKVYRLSLLSETRAMTEQAGFSIHPQTKPPLSSLSNFPDLAADRPAFSALPATGASGCFVGVENSIFNLGTFRYYESNIRHHYGQEFRDTKTYPFRETPIGCVYLLPELQALARMEAEYSGVNQEEADKTRYSRLSGVFFSGNGPYRIYNTERTAIKLRKNGEETMRSYINSWAGMVYKRSLTLVRDDGHGNPVEESIEPKIRGAILFGDETHQAAVSVILQTIQSEIGYGRGRDEKELSKNYNLRIIPDTYYLPVIQEAIPLYALMVFPHWPMYLKEFGKEYWRSLCKTKNASAIIREYIGEMTVDGELEDGSTLVTLAALHLDTVRWIMGELPLSEKPFTILTMEWQEPFWKSLLKEIHPEDAEKLNIIFIPQEELERYVEILHYTEEVPYRL
ncbi:hypothetical protein [Anaerotruncus colihominis]|uniref:Uncharacterized protein n=1 Tax=Anaerotruncus colihominis TaxID=169435 RepID=A0A845STZ4_9FIRM|nr:hypothetical protein [Anaerotruncus colihominis]NDO37782.1 hypothetical protein [Anaerotruncus colihominis]